MVTCNFSKYSGEENLLRDDWGLCYWGHIFFITWTLRWQHHAAGDARPQDPSRTPRRAAPPRGLRLLKMASIMEGPLSKWTNVMKGWQYRWFVLDYNAGLLSYYTVSRFVLCGRHAAARLDTESCRGSPEPKVRRCGPAVCQELGVSAGSPGRFLEDGFLRWPIAKLLSHRLTNRECRWHTSANLAAGF